MTGRLITADILDSLRSAMIAHGCAQNLQAELVAKTKDQIVLELEEAYFGDDVAVHLDLSLPDAEGAAFTGSLCVFKLVKAIGQWGRFSTLLDAWSLNEWTVTWQDSTSFLAEPRTTMALEMDGLEDVNADDPLMADFQALANALGQWGQSTRKRIWRDCYRASILDVDSVTLWRLLLEHHQWADFTRALRDESLDGGTGGACLAAAPEVSVEGCDPMVVGRDDSGVGYVLDTDCAPIVARQEWLADLWGVEA